MDDEICTILEQWKKMGMAGLRQSMRNARVRGLASEIIKKDILQKNITLQ